MFQGFVLVGEVVAAEVQLPLRRGAIGSGSFQRPSAMRSGSRSCSCAGALRSASVSQKSAHARVPLQVAPPPPTPRAVRGVSPEAHPRGEAAQVVGAVGDEEDVGAGEVTVQHPAGVHVRHGAGDLLGAPQHLRPAQDAGCFHRAD